MALWDEKFQSTEEKQCADRILDAWDDSNVCPICIQHMENGHRCEEEDAPIYDQMAYVRKPSNDRYSSSRSRGRMKDKPVP